MPISTSTLMEGSPNPGDGDRHVLVLDRDNCWLYELGGSYPQGDGTWQAAAGAVWDLLNANARPFGGRQPMRQVFRCSRASCDMTRLQPAISITRSV